MAENPFADEQLPTMGDGPLMATVRAMLDGYRYRYRPPACR
jgi:hypothetical protein